MEPIDLNFALSLKPEKAIEYLNTKGYRISFRWDDIEAQAHAKAFTVAGAMKLDILETIRGELTAALESGTTFAQFKKELTPRLQKLGWYGKAVEVVNEQTGEVRTTRVDGHRLRTIYTTNLQSAYSAGRYDGFMADDNIKYLRYNAILDRKTRRTHAEMNGIILPKDHPWWDTNYPPNGWRCRCSVSGVTESRMKRNGWKPFEGDPKGIADPAFQNNPGKDKTPIDTVAWQKAEKVSTSARLGFVKDMIRPEQRQKVWDYFVDDVAEAMQHKGKVRTLTYLEPELFELINKGKVLKSPIVIATDKQVLHAMRNGKNAPETLKLATDAVNNPEEVWEGQDDILFIKTINGVATKFAFKLQKRGKEIDYRALNLVTVGPFDRGADGYKKIR
jgi:SPP1 gp7 family putative phage head morphogenesis protein